VLDEGLFDVPFAALVVGETGKPVYLIERHSVRIISALACGRGGA
jgi:CHAT domain-containing protein